MNPLNDDEYDQLDALLLDLGAQTMDVAAVEGLLTALVVGPAEILPEVWLPKVWGGADGSEPARALILRHYDYMRTWMQKDPGSFEPIYECGGSWTADAWASGFVTGMELDAPAWAPLRASQPALLVPFQRNGDNWADRIPPAVIQINAFFHAPEAKAVKVGRNDPCPCGSGQKYKKCCGA